MEVAACQPHPPVAATRIGGGYCLWVGLGCWAAWPMGIIPIT